MKKQPTQQDWKKLVSAVEALDPPKILVEWEGQVYFGKIEVYRKRFCFVTVDDLPDCPGVWRSIQSVVRSMVLKEPIRISEGSQI